MLNNWLQHFTFSVIFQAGALEDLWSVLWVQNSKGKKKKEKGASTFVDIKKAKFLESTDKGSYISGFQN